MQLRSTFTILALLATASAHVVSRDDSSDDSEPMANFSKSCGKVTIPKGGNYMEAECVAKDGSKKKSSLDLNFCIRQTYGGMEPHADGHFWGNPGCTGCQVDKNEQNILRCTCMGSQLNTFKTAELDLDRMVANSDGLLECYGHGAESA
ncbi:CVNH domain-containing protein [Aspergillus bertholletiae]|uniref:CVNH domain-containing protein n=1 Tax=Aspergillus bertholletiae TaxID=1226010 RepID=A0A5N7ARF5_9EURO|nr:CVNH domain-containing protein [Aspergillus bertholletiae]